MEEASAFGRERASGLVCASKFIARRLCFRDYFKRTYGPTIAVYKFVADDPDRVAALDNDLVELARRFDIGTGTTRMEWEYLLLTARRG